MRSERFSLELQLQESKAIKKVYFKIEKSYKQSR